MNLAPLHEASARAMAAQAELQKRHDELDEAILQCVIEKAAHLSRRYPKRHIVVREGMGMFSVEIETHWPGMRESEHALEAVVSTYRGEFDLSYEGPRGSEAERADLFDGMLDLWSMIPDDLDYIPYPTTKDITFLNGERIEG